MKPAFSHYYFPRCIFWSRWGWTGHWGAVRGPPGGCECHADPQRAAVHVLRRSHCQSLWPGGRCRWSLSPVSGCKDESVDVVNSVFFICCRVMNVWLCLRVTAPKWAVCWCPLLPLCIIVSTLVLVIRPFAVTVWKWEHSSFSFFVVN